MHLGGEQVHRSVLVFFVITTSCSQIHKMLYDSNNQGATYGRVSILDRIYSRFIFLYHVSSFERQEYLKRRTMCAFFSLVEIMV